MGLILFGLPIAIALGVSFGLTMLFSKNLFVRIAGIVFIAPAAFMVCMSAPFVIGGGINSIDNIFFCLVFGFFTIWSCFNGYFIFRKKNTPFHAALGIFSWSTNAILVWVLVMAFLLRGGM